MNQHHSCATLPRSPIKTATIGFLRLRKTWLLLLDQAQTIVDLQSLVNAGAWQDDMVGTIVEGWISLADYICFPPEVFWRIQMNVNQHIQDKRSCSPGVRRVPGSCMPGAFFMQSEQQRLISLEQLASGRRATIFFMATAFPGLSDKQTSSRVPSTNSIRHQGSENDGSLYCFGSNGNSTQFNAAQRHRDETNSCIRHLSRVLHASMIRNSSLRSRQRLMSTGRSRNGWRGRTPFGAGT
jgi:hypothetical protein